jgi:sigma-B regulation protein RsbU (phosphoserine phosphatase)
LYKVTEATRFATFFYAEWNRGEQCLSYVNAGHNPPILRGLGGSRQLEAGSPPLGLFHPFELRVEKVPLRPGELIVLYSDGITEAGVHRGEQFGEDRLEAVVAAHAGRPPAEILQQILASVRQWSGPEPEDDMTLLLVRAAEVAEEGA